MIPFSTFYFEKFSFDKETLKTKFYYSFDKKENFVEEVDFSVDFLEKRIDFQEEILNNFLFSLSIAIWISYYKAYPTNKLVVETGFLSTDDILFWQKFYKNWLWEFLYRNNLNSYDYFCFKNSSEKYFKKINFISSEKSLLPIGWWKDSIVSLKILEELWKEFTPIIFWKTDTIKENCLKVLWKKEILIKRKIDENLFKLNEKGYYNWHVPITWIISFALLVTAYIYDYKYIILSNEKSANVWNLSIWDLEVNHQWSKSLDFEQELSKYIERNLSSDIKYFSLLRWMYEINIAKMFSLKGKEYFKVFSSCNWNFKINKNWKQDIKDYKKNWENNISINVRNSESIQRTWISEVDRLLRSSQWQMVQNLTSNDYSLIPNHWCKSCPKCAFVYSILRPFLSYDETLEIWWKELYEEKYLESLFRELLWIQWIKPFECVWEEKEVILAMNMLLNQFKKDWKKIPYILEIFAKEVKNWFVDSYYTDLENELFMNYYDETFIPIGFRN